MQDTIITEPTPTSHLLAAALPAAKDCEDCQGTGGWFRYEPALERSAGSLYLSCLQCRGTGSDSGSGSGRILPASA